MPDSPRDPRRLRDELSDERQLEETAIETLERMGPAGVIRERHPRGLVLLFIVEMWERFSFYGMRALLTLYMLAPIVSDDPEILDGGLGWQERLAGPVFGWYAALAFLLPFWGGMLADKLLGTHRSMVVGGIVIAAGHGTLACMGLFAPGSTETMVAFFAGLALVVIGTGFFKPCVSVMVGQLYRERDPRRDAGFTIFYMGINVGALGGTLLCGLLGEKVGWHWGFGAAGVGMVAGVIVYLLLRPRMLPGIGLAPEVRASLGNVARTVFGSIGIVAVAIAVYLLVQYLGRTRADLRPGWLGWTQGISMDLAGTLETATVLVLAAAVLVAISWFIAAQAPAERGPTTALFIISFFVMFFFLAFEQAGTSMNQFALDRTDREILGGWKFPATWLQAVNPAMILVFAPLFALLWTMLARRRRDPNIAIKIGVGLILAGAGFALLVVAGRASDGGAPLPEGAAPVLVGWWWLGGAYLLHTWGELCLSPIGLSLTTKLAPRRWVSLMMGVWFLAPAAAQLIGGYVFGAVDEIETRGVLGMQGRGGYFLLFVLVGVVPGVVIIALTPLMRRLVGDRA